MGNDNIAPGRYGQLENMIVLRILQKWPPEEVNGAFVSHTTDVVEHVVDVRVSQPNLLRDPLHPPSPR
jgi:hypothetical protein